MAEIGKLDLKSKGITEEQRAKLREVFPEVFTEDKIDFDKLRMTLGEDVDADEQHFGMMWPGKRDCFKVIQEPSIATLKPCKKASVNWDTTENLFIEGDNLEVLKQLQKSYYGKIKMIYIDPPYNTGNEFIYPDKYSESLETYLAYTGQVNTEGRRFSTNTETDGRFHSKWINMMYPRLFLARNLLKQSGVIFISIDDNEVKNLRAICDDIFGEENFIATIIWQKVYSPKNSAKYFSDDHDYIMVYAKNSLDWLPTLLPRTEEANARYENTDNDPRGPWKPSDLTARNYYSLGQYEVVGPTGKKFVSGRGRYWRQSYEKFMELDADNQIWWGPNGDAMPAQKRFLSEVKQGIVPQTLWTYQEVGHTQEAKKELLKYTEFEHTENVLNSVKPTRLIRRMIQIGTSKDDNDIVLDFFAGSGPTAQALLQQNLADSGNRRFILIQLPEPLPKKEAKVKTIADLACSRIRNFAKEVSDSNGNQLSLEKTNCDLGFRVLKLDKSNFRIWEGDVEDTPIEQQLAMAIDHIDPDSSDEDIFFEILLKSGFEPTTPIEELTLEYKKVYAIAEGALLICLEKELTKEVIRAIAEKEPHRVVCLDSGFTGNDQLKTNAVQIMKSFNVESFRTV